MQGGCETVPGAGEGVAVLKDRLPAEALDEDTASPARADALHTFETRRLEGTSMDAVSGCTSSGFTTQTEASELPSSEVRRAGGVLPRSSSRAVPQKKSCRSSLLLVGGDVVPPSPTKSLERRPVLFRSTAAESLHGSTERGGREGPVAHDARTGFATSLKLLAENLVNESARTEGSPPQASPAVSGEAPIVVTTDALPPPIEMPPDVATVTHVASETSVTSPPDVPHVPSTGAFTAPMPDSMFSYEVNVVENEPPSETVVVQPAPRVASHCSVQVLRVEVPEAPVHPDHFANLASRDEAPMAGSTLPLNADAPRGNRPAQIHHYPHQHTIPPLVAPLCTRWCCAKISMISMAIMSLFAAFMIYAFREDTFVDLVNWAATWNTSSIRAKFAATQAMPEAENVTESAILKRSVT